MRVTRLILLAFVVPWLVANLPNSSPGVAAVQTDKREELRYITVRQLKTLLEKKEAITILDVRMDFPYSASLTKIKGAKHISPDDIEAHLKEIPPDKEIVTYCS